MSGGADAGAVAAPSPRPRANTDAYGSADSAKARTTFPLPDVEWEPTREYWAGASAGELRLPFCVACGRANWYPQAACSSCEGTFFAWRAVSGKGTLFSYSVVRHPFLPQYADLLPMVAAVVVLDDVPDVRIVTRLVDCDPDELVCDAPVEVVFGPLEFKGIQGKVVAPLFRLRH